MKKETRLNHPERVTPKENNPPTTAPIYQTAKFILPEVPSSTFSEEIFVYSRGGNPTLRTLEKVLAEVCDKEDALVLSSGMAAIAVCCISLLKQGDHAILFLESYKPSRILFKNELSRFGITCSFATTTDFSSLERNFIPGKTKLILFESMTNPVGLVPDVEEICDWAKSKNILTVLDSTFSGIHQNDGSPADFLIQSLTKYAAGHGDVCGGAILGNKALMSQIKMTAYTIGAMLDPHAAFLILRGLKTYVLRYEAQSSRALEISIWLEKQPQIEKVFYPGLSSHPNHSIAKKQFSHFGSVISVQLSRNTMNAQEFVSKLKVFHFAVSLGSTESLATPAFFFFANDLTPDELSISGIDDRTVRLAIGIESVDDLIDDLKQALGVNA